MIALSGSVFGCFHLQLLAPIMQIYEEGIYLVVSNVCSYLISLIAIFLFYGDVKFSLDPEKGIFGFLHSE